MFVGHPPTLQRLWHLPADLVRTPLEELRARHEVKLLSLQELLRLLKRRQRALDQVLARLLVDEPLQRTLVRGECIVVVEADYPKK